VLAEHALVLNVWSAKRCGLALLRMCYLLTPH
jgi:hypothetical protein